MPRNRNNPESLKRDREITAAWRTKLRQTVIEMYGGKCNCCGETTPEFLALDHIRGGGLRDRRETGDTSGRKTYREARDNFQPEKFQVLCHNCNLAKGFYGACPHTRKA